MCSCQGHGVAQARAKYMARMSYPMGTTTIPTEDFNRLMCLQPPCQMHMSASDAEAAILDYLGEIGIVRFGSGLGRYWGQHRRHF